MSVKLGETIQTLVDWLLGRNEEHHLEMKRLDDAIRHHDSAAKQAHETGRDPLEKVHDSIDANEHDHIPVKWLRQDVAAMIDGESKS
jgi:hypothetical protein